MYVSRSVTTMSAKSARSSRCKYSWAITPANHQLSLTGHSRPARSTPVAKNGRYASDSDRIREFSQKTLSTISVNRRRRCRHPTGDSQIRYLPRRSASGPHAETHSGMEFYDLAASEDGPFGSIAAMIAAWTFLSCTFTAAVSDNRRCRVS